MLISWGKPAFHIAALLIGVLLGISAGSCEGLNSNSTGPAYTGPRNHCANNNDCDTGFCHPESAICVLNISGTGEMLARVTFDSPVLRPQLFHIPIKSTETLELEPTPPVAVKDISTAVAANILFSDLSNTLPGEDADVFAYKTYLDAAEFYLVPGKYDVTFYPAGEDAHTCPIYYLEEISLRDDGTFWKNDTQVSISVPADGREMLTANVYYASADSKTTASDLSVQALEPSTSRPLSLPVPLTANTTCTGSSPYCGNMTIPLWQSTRSVTLRFYKPGEPSYPATLYPIEDLNFSVRQDIFIEKPEAPVLVTGKISTRSASSQTEPPPLCRVLIEMVGDDAPLLQFWTTTNEYGNIERAEGAEGIYLYPGTYSVTAYPIADFSANAKSYAPSELPGNLVVTGQPDANTDATNEVTNHFSLPLQQRIKITGNIRWAETTPIPSAKLATYNIGPSHPYSSVILGTTNEQGEFQLWTDNSPYLMVASAPAISKFASGIQVLNIPSSDSYEFTVNVQIPFLIAGTMVMDKTNQWFESVEQTDITIEWFIQFGQSAYLVSRSAIDSAYRFTALLPPK